MAIQESLLFGRGSKGTIGKQITMYPLKGQQVARIRVIPTNPNTAAQQAQRAILTKVVGEYHTAGLTDDDLSAYNRWASASYRTQSGYNRFSSERIGWYKAGDDESILKNVTITYASATTATVDCDLATGNSATVYYGTSKTSQPSTQAMTDDADGTFSATLSGLSTGVQYYLYILYKDTTDAQSMRTGLYAYLHESS